MNRKEVEKDTQWLEIEGKNRADALERACVALNTTQAYLDFEFLNNKQTKLKARKSEEELNLKPSKNKKFKKNSNKKQALNGSKAKGALNVKAKKDSGKDDIKDLENTADMADDQYEEINIEDTDIEIEATELGLNAKKKLENILKYIDTSVEVVLKETEKKICLDVHGEGTGLVIGKRGQTLESLQHIVAKSIGLDRNSEKRLLLDAQGYRERRQDSLQSLAQRMASKASRERRSIGLEPMSAMDRRVIHMALADHNNVTTKSIGEGGRRKVLIVPDNARKRNSRSNTAPSSRPSSSKPVDGNKKQDAFGLPYSSSLDNIPDNIDELAELSDEELKERLGVDSLEQNVSEQASAQVDAQDSNNVSIDADASDDSIVSEAVEAVKKSKPRLMTRDDQNA